MERWIRLICACGHLPGLKSDETIHPKADRLATSSIAFSSDLNARLGIRTSRWKSCSQASSRCSKSWRASNRCCCWKQAHSNRCSHCCCCWKQVHSNRCSHCCCCWKQACNRWCSRCWRSWQANSRCWRSFHTIRWRKNRWKMHHPIPHRAPMHRSP